MARLNNIDYFKRLVTELKRSQAALIEVAQEAHINGVSTIKIGQLAKKLGVESLSASQVSDFNKNLDEQVTEFRGGPLPSEYPILWLDAV
jgi:putative transposase